MKAVKNLVEYYDELFPVTEIQENFYTRLGERYKNPVKFLRLFCGSGLLENHLAKKGHDVTGIETEPELLQAANLRRRSQLMAIRFFKMSLDEVSQYLGKGFYNVISVLDSRLMFLKTEEEILKFFNTCKSLLSEDGIIVLQMLNFEKFCKKPLNQLPEKDSIRAKMFCEMWDDGKKKTLSLNLETGNGKVINIMKDEVISAITPKDIEYYSEKAGFSCAEFYAGFDMTVFTGNEDSYIVVLK